MQGKKIKQFVLITADAAWNFLALVGLIAIHNRWGDLTGNWVAGTLAEYIANVQVKNGWIGRPIYPAIIGLGIGMIFIIYIVIWFTLDPDSEEEA